MEGPQAALSRGHSLPLAGPEGHPCLFPKLCEARSVPGHHRDQAVEPREEGPLFSCWAASPVSPDLGRALLRTGLSGHALGSQDFSRASQPLPAGDHLLQKGELWGESKVNPADALLLKAGADGTLQASSERAPRTPGSSPSVFPKDSLPPSFQARPSLIADHAPPWFGHHCHVVPASPGQPLLPCLTGVELRSVQDVQPGVGEPPGASESLWGTWWGRGSTAGPPILKAGASEP